MTGTIWAVLGLLLILSEFVVPQFVVFFFGAGALLNALLVAVLSPLRSRVVLQIILWLFTSSLSLALMRKYFSRWFRGEEYHSADDSAPGKTGRVVEAIPDNGTGRVSFGGTTWQARCLEGPIAKGTTVTVLEKEGLALTVTPGDLLHDQLDSEDASKA